MEELKRIIDDSEITKEDDALWPPPDRVGRQVCWMQQRSRSRIFSKLVWVCCLLPASRGQRGFSEAGAELWVLLQVPGLAPRPPP